jgi:hypothetical protein
LESCALTVPMSSPSAAIVKCTCEREVSSDVVLYTTTWLKLKVRVELVQYLETLL